MKQGVKISQIYASIRTRFSGPLILFVLLLPAVQPLLSGHLPWRADGLLHFHRLAQLERAINFGALYPRWLPDLGYGYGFPLFNYYAPLSYYLMLPWRWLGLSTATAMQMGYGTALLALGLGIYWWAQGRWGRLAGWLAAVAAVYAPYTLYNGLHRGALPEMWGLAWLALTFAALDRFIQDQNCAANGKISRQDAKTQTRQGQQFALLAKWLSFRPYLNSWSGTAVALAYAALLLTHNILALIGTPLLVVYALFVERFDQPKSILKATKKGAEIPDYPLGVLAFWRAFRLKSALILITPLLLGLGLSAFFWLPALAEKELVQIHQLTAPANFHYGNNFLDWSEVVATPQPADPAQVNPEIAFGLGWPQLLLALLLFWPGRGPPQPALSQVEVDAKVQKAFLGFLAPWNGLLLLLLALSLFMSLPLSRPLWDLLPLLPFVQFPWRFMGPATLFLALLAGAGGLRLANRDRRLAPLVLAGVLLYALFWLFPSPASVEMDPSPLDTIRFEQESGALGTTSAADYLPVAVAELPPPDSLQPFYETAADQPIPRLMHDNLPEGVAILAEESGFATVTLHYQATNPFTAQFYIYYFPGWQARLNGETLPVYAAGPHGLLTVDLPANQHELRLVFGSTPLRRLASLISQGSVLLLFWWVRPVSAGSYTPQIVPKARLNWAVVAALVLTTIAILTAKLAYLEQADTVFRRTPFDGQQLTQVAQPLQVNFGQQLILLGHELAPPVVAADELLDIVLYWRVASPVTAEYSVAVHLVDDLGRRFGQHDSFHPANYPTTRWQAGEYARDRHRLEIWPGTPPGRYQLLVTVYYRSDGRQLEYLNDNGQPLGISYPLAEIVVMLPDRPLAAVDLSLDVPIDQELAPGLRLLGSTVLPTTITVGQPLPFTLFWQATAPLADYQARLQLLDSNDGQLVAQMVWAPGRQTFSTAAWPPGTVVRDERAFLIPPGRGGEPDQPLAAGSYTPVLDLIDGQGQQAGTAVPLAEISVAVPERRFLLPDGVTAVGVSYDQIIELAAYQLAETDWQPGDFLPLTLFWRSLALTGQSLAVFVHLVGEDDRIYSQQDSLPMTGARPTTGWLPGEIVADSYHLWLPADLPLGSYELRVGLYDPASGRRLLLPDGAGDYWQLAITVK